MLTAKGRAPKAAIFGYSTENQRLNILHNLTVIVFDHMGHIPQPLGTKHPAFALIRRLIDKGRTWVKLSVASDNTKDGPPTYADVTRSRGHMCKPLRNASCGAATGRTRKRISQTMLDYSSETMCERILLENPCFTVSQEILRRRHPKNAGTK